MTLGWYALPCEIRLMILKLLSDDGSKTCAYASVNAEWQDFFEARNFHRLILRPSCISKFNQIVYPERRRLVKHIWLRFETPPYSCSHYKKNQTREEEARANRRFTRAIWSLLGALSSWEVGDGGLVLELSVHSPSDRYHYFPDYRIDKGIYPHAQDEKCTYREYAALVPCTTLPQSASERRRHHRHGWLNGVRISEPEGHSAERVFSNQMELDFSGFREGANKELSSVSVVKGLLIRRQYFRAFDPVALGRILQSLPGVEILTLEIWREISPLLESNYQMDLTELLGRVKPLKSLAIFEDCNSLFNRYERPKLSPILGWMLAVMSHSITQLSVAFVANAEDFFRPFYFKQSTHISSLSPETIFFLTSLFGLYNLKSFAEEALGTDQRASGNAAPSPFYEPEWPNLESLILTSQLLQPSKFKNKINAMLLNAANAAMRMPKLRAMEIWNGKKGAAFIFTYLRYGVNQWPTIYITSTWQFELKITVFDAWERVAEKHMNRGLVMRMQRLDGGAITSYGSVVGLLKLRQQVLHPVSLCQLKWETNKLATS
ncbi:hypothetical protein PT974_02791 [Cladobotryum mycophilum]|uniref:DUF6546 domain-containing protein n=1 Tax=Cladobotryum mycophilum TaxID=491253 RepID=A0ABR0SZ19_9HYPO